ncbi:MAG TPA: hypothetical protein PLW01_12525, partial [Agitococcus sp.]|nr:hypothetical protein [Agitococcus sp.]
MMVSLSRIVRCGLIAASAIGLSACSKDQILGNHIRQFTLDHALPVILKTDDVPMICNANDGLAPLVMAYGRFNVEID